MHDIKYVSRQHDFEVGTPTGSALHLMTWAPVVGEWAIEDWTSSGGTSKISAEESCDIFIA